jgi:Lon protease-like protein
VERFRVIEEDHSRAYRLAAIEPLGEPELRSEDRAQIRTCRSRLESLLTPAVERAGADSKMPAAMADGDLVNALAQYLDLEPLEKQALLERPGLASRAASLVELLEMKMMAARTPGVTNMAH